MCCGSSSQRASQLDTRPRPWADESMAAKGMYDTVKQAIQDLIAPDLERIKGQLTGVDARISALDKRMDSLEKRVDEGLGALRQEMQAGFRSVDDRIDTLKERVTETNKRLDEALDIRERLATLEAKFAARG
jgi:chromosome segregation ATPase